MTITIIIIAAILAVLISATFTMTITLLLSLLSPMITHKGLYSYTGYTAAILGGYVFDVVLLLRWLAKLKRSFLGIQ